MKRFLILFALLLVGSTPAFGQDSLAKIKELADTDSVHVPALLRAVLQGETETVKTLIKEGEDVNEDWRYREDEPYWYIRYRPLELATRLGNMDIMRLLLDNGAETERYEEGGIIFISIFRYAKDIETAQLLLDHGADPAGSLLGVYDPNIAQFFIDNGADVNSMDEFVGTPLHGVAWRGDMDMVQLLISNGADVNASADAYIRPLHQTRNAEIAQILIDNGADIHAGSDAGTPLHTADNAEIAQILINSGADVNNNNGGYGTPLHEASSRNKKDVAQTLIDHGADVHAKKYNGRTPLHEASYHGEKDVAQILIDSGADMNAKDNDGKTPLHLAAESYSDEVYIVQILIDHGADVNAKNNDGRTPLDIAIERGRDEIADLLREHGGVATE